MKERTRAILIFVLDVLVNILVILGLVFILRVYIIFPFQVSGPSMCDTFNYFEDQCLRGNGEYILLNKFGYQNFFGWQVGLPERGDVVVFHPPEGEPGEYYIKRVIGVPGDTIEIREGYVYVSNDEWEEAIQLEESDYLNALNWGHTDVPARSIGTYEVPEGSYFVLGDNRRVSSDSRRCFEQEGCDEDASPYITLEHIEGKAWFVFWPLNRIRIVDDVNYELEAAVEAS